MMTRTSLLCCLLLATSHAVGAGSQKTTGSALDCAATLPAGMKATASFSPERRGVVAMVDVTFRGRRPTSADAERVLRGCMDAALKQFGRAVDVMGTAWHSASGQDADDKMVPVTDGSDHLVFDTKTGKILTWKEREGTKTVRSTNPTGGYFVEYEEENVLVRPGDKFATVNVVWAKKPDTATIYRVLIDELKKAVAKQPRKWPTTAFANTGSRANPSSQQQIRGSTRAYINVEYNPKTGNVTDEQGKVVDAIK
jgi:hypothetical protein